MQQTGHITSIKGMIGQNVSRMDLSFISTHIGFSQTRAFSLGLDMVESRRSGPVGSAGHGCLLDKMAPVRRAVK